METFTREQLIKGMELYNKDFVNNPDQFDEVDDSALCAKRQINTLIGYTKKANRLD